MTKKRLEIETAVPNHLKSLEKIKAQMDWGELCQRMTSLLL